MRIDQELRDDEHMLTSGLGTRVCETGTRGIFKMEFGTYT